jgi:hypothetical protein
VAKRLLDVVANTVTLTPRQQAPEFSHSGKQVLRSGEHFADAASPEIAEALVHVLSGEVLLPLDLSEEKQDWIQKVLWP